MNIVNDTYKVIKTFPDFERYNSISQLIRCAVCIPSNISEGTSRSTDKHFNKYIEDSLGSAFEWETQLNSGLSSKVHFQRKISSFRK